MPLGICDLLVESILSFLERLLPLKIINLLECLFADIDFCLLVDLNFMKDVFVLVLGRIEERLHDELEQVEVQHLVPATARKP